MTNTGKAYESLTELVFRELLSQSNVCSDIQRNVVIQGRSTSHQIDVSFNFTVGVVAYKTIVECKDWSSPVDQEKVLAFKAVVDDIPGQPRGIMISRSGFQEGAWKVAAHHGINVYELREPQERDFEGRLRAIECNLSIMHVEFRNYRFGWDQDWIQNQMVQRNLPTLELRIELHPGIDKVTYLSGSPCDLNEILNSHGLHGSCDWTSVHHEFREPVVIEVANCPIELRANALDWDVLISDPPTSEVTTIRVTPNVAYCLKDVLTGEIQYLDPDSKLTSGGGRIIPVGD